MSITEDWSGKFVQINKSDNTALTIFSSRDHANFPRSMKIPGGDIVSPFKDAPLKQMAAVDIYPLLDVVPVHDRGWQTANPMPELQDNFNHYERKYQIVEKPVQAVADDKRARIEARRSQLEADGFNFMGVSYDSDDRSIQRITGAAVLGLVVDKLNEPAIAAVLATMGVELPVSQSLNWTAGDNSIQTLNPVQLWLMALAAAQYVETVFIVSQTHKTSIDDMLSNGATPQEVWQYDHTVGWPESAGLGEDS